MKGVKTAKVDFAKKTALVTMTAGSTLAEKSTTSAIKGLGFGVSSFKLVSKPAKAKLAKFSMGIGGMT